MTNPIAGTSPNIKWGAMDGIPVGVFEGLNGEGKKEISLNSLPLKVESFIGGITNNLSRIFCRKSFLNFHCGRRRYKIFYVCRELGSVGWIEQIIFICPICGNAKEKTNANTSGIPF